MQRKTIIIKMRVAKINFPRMYRIRKRLMNFWVDFSKILLIFLKRLPDYIIIIRRTCSYTLHLPQRNEQQRALKFKL